MRDGKWIPELTAQTPVVDAARWALDLRLATVRAWLGLALREPARDLERVHQLRVSSRRAAAALQIFAACLPERDHRHARKYLRGLRRTAGAARDWDVFYSDISSAEHRARSQAEPGLHFLNGYALARRADAQRELLAAHERFPFDFEQFLADTLGALRPPRDGPRYLVELARPLLGTLLRDLQTAAERDLSKYENLHQVRIAGKRLRYAMEILAGCGDKDLQDLYYPMIEDMQEILGLANDSQVALRRLDELRSLMKAFQPLEWKQCRPAIEALLRSHRRRLPVQRTQFQAWWQRWQQQDVSAAIANALSHQRAGVEVGTTLVGTVDSLAATGAPVTEPTGGFNPTEGDGAIGTTAPPTGRGQQTPP
jgi:CHAD domain-containing protein